MLFPPVEIRDCVGFCLAFNLCRASVLRLIEVVSRTLRVA